jgi:hypothetical protein
MYREEMQIKLEYGCDAIIIGEAVALGLENSFCSFS